jgi:hypothetical protein
VEEDNIKQNLQNNINKKYIEYTNFSVNTNNNGNNNNNVNSIENINSGYNTHTYDNTQSTDNMNLPQNNIYWAVTNTATMVRTIPTSVAENLSDTAPNITTTSSYIPEDNNTDIEIPLSPAENENDSTLVAKLSNIWKWMNTTVFAVKGINISYLYIIIAAVSVVLIFSLLLLICIVRRRHKNKIKRMKLIDVNNSSNLRNMLDETTNSQDAFDNHLNKDEFSHENILIDNKDDYLDINDYANYLDNKLSSSTTKRYQTLPLMKNPSAAHSTGKTIDAFQSNYNKMSSPVFPTSSPKSSYRKNSIYNTNYDCEFDSGYNFYSQNMKLNKSMIKNKTLSLKSSTKSLKNKGKSSPMASNHMDYLEDSPDLMNDRNNDRDRDIRNDNVENDMMDINNNNNNVYPDDYNFDDINYNRNPFKEKKYNSMPRFNNYPKYSMNTDNKRHPMSVITPKEQYNMNYQTDFHYQQQSPSSPLNTLSPIKNSLPTYMNFNDSPNQLNKMVSPTTRFGSAPTPLTKNENLILPPINVLNDENLINETKRYPVDLDYLARYSYQPVVNDELDISMRDRIHLLQTYSDGWAYGKNVTTGKLGVFPLNRLFSVKRAKSDRESEKTKVNVYATMESPKVTSKRISYSLSNLQRKNASQETLIDRKNSNSNTEKSSESSSGSSSNNVNIISNRKVKPKKSRTLIIKNFSDEDLRDKSQSTNNDKLDISSIDRKKNSYSYKRDSSNDKQYFSNLRDSDNSVKSKSRKKEEKEENDFDSVLRLKIDFDDNKYNKPITTKQVDNDDDDIQYNFKDVYIPYI